MNPPDTAFIVWMDQTQAEVETTLSALLPPAEGLLQRLHGAMRYAALGGGKRIRPLLVHAAGAITGASAHVLAEVAAALEMIHVYSLVHDDLPAMDNDVLRRGRPTCHVEYDEATALLVGDSLQTLAFETLAQIKDISPERRLKMVSLLAHASGSRGMAGGQAIDLASVGQELDQPGLELMHSLKTGALIHAAVKLGVLAGSLTLTHDEDRSVDQFARRAGLLFQVVDDILDCTASTASLGKTAGKDAASDKPTYVSLLGLTEARAYAEELRRDTLSTLAVFGNKAHRLSALADFICRRQF